MDTYFNIEKAIQATDGYDAYQRLFAAWAKAYVEPKTRRFIMFADFVRHYYPEIYNRARAYARVMGDL
jgi:exoribonuclease II